MPAPVGEDADGTPMPEWTAYTAESPRVMDLYDEIRMEPADADAKREVMLRANKEAFAKKLEG